MYLLDDPWNLIKEFLLDWKKWHKIKMDFILKYKINDRFSPKYQRWTHFPPPPNTNNIIEHEYPGEIEDWMLARPLQNLPLTAITYNIKGTGGWWCGYGWQKNIM